MWSLVPLLVVDQATGDQLAQRAAGPTPWLDLVITDRATYAYDGVFVEALEPGAGARSYFLDDRNTAEVKVTPGDGLDDVMITVTGQPGGLASSLEAPAVQMTSLVSTGAARTEYVGGSDDQTLWSFGVAVLGQDTSPAQTEPQVLPAGSFWKAELDMVTGIRLSRDAREPTPGASPTDSPGGPGSASPESRPSSSGQSPSSAFAGGPTQPSGSSSSGLPLTPAASSTPSHEAISPPPSGRGPSSPSPSRTSPESPAPSGPRDASGGPAWTALPGAGAPPSPVALVAGGLMVAVGLAVVTRRLVRTRQPGHGADTGPRGFPQG